MRKPIYGVDVDDVLLQTVPAWLKMSNMMYGGDIEEKDIKSWDIASYVKNCSAYDFHNLLDDNLYKLIKPVDNALWGVLKLQSMGRVIYVTSNFGNVRDAKIKALNRFGFDVDKRDFIETSDKSLIACDYLIDDNPDNVIHAYNNGIIYTKPWNESLSFRYRADSWIDVVNFLSKSEA